MEDQHSAEVAITWAQELKTSLVSGVRFHLKKQKNKQKNQSPQRHPASNTATNKTQKIISVDKDVGKQNPLYTTAGTYTGTAAVENQQSRAVWPELYSPAIPLLRTKELEEGIRKDIYTPLSTEALFIIVKRWKQPDEQLNKMWYTYTME